MSLHLGRKGFEWLICSGNMARRSLLLLFDSLFVAFLGGGKITLSCFSFFFLAYLVLFLRAIF